MKKEYFLALSKANNILHFLPRLEPYNNCDIALKSLASSSLRRIVLPTQQLINLILICEKDKIPLEETEYSISLNEIIIELKFILGQWIYCCDTDILLRTNKEKQFFIDLFEKSSENNSSLFN